MKLQDLKNKIDVLPGHKTYLLIIAAILVNSFYLTHFIDEVGMQVINTMLGFLGLGTIALKIDRIHTLEINEHNKMKSTKTE